MKRFAGALAFILLWSFTTQLATSQVLPWKGPEWSLFLKTSGAPWDKKFEVLLNHTGALSVTTEDPAKRPGVTTAKVVVNLSANDAQEIYEQALKAFRDFSFAKEKEEIADGTNLELRLTVDKRSLSMEVLHLSMLHEQLPEVSKLLDLLNKHIPKEHYIF